MDKADSVGYACITLAEHTGHGEDHMPDAACLLVDPGEPFLPVLVTAD